METGGFLMGKRRGLHIEVTGYSLQGAEDIATPSSIERLDQSHTDQLVLAWTKEQGKVGMVGDWHSHPGSDATPSGTDKRAWRQLVAVARADCIGLILSNRDEVRTFLTRRGGIFPRSQELVCVGREAQDLIYGQIRSPS